MASFSLISIQSPPSNPPNPPSPYHTHSLYPPSLLLLSSTHTKFVNLTTRTHHLYALRHVPVENPESDSDRSGSERSSYGRICCGELFDGELGLGILVPPFSTSCVFVRFPSASSAWSGGAGGGGGNDDLANARMVQLRGDLTDAATDAATATAASCSCSCVAVVGEKLNRSFGSNDRIVCFGFEDGIVMIVRVGYGDAIGYGGSQSVSVADLRIVQIGVWRRSDGYPSGSLLGSLGSGLLQGQGRQRQRQRQEEEEEREFGFVSLKIGCVGNVLAVGCRRIQQRREMQYQRQVQGQMQMPVCICPIEEIVAAQGQATAAAAAAAEALFFVERSPRIGVLCAVTRTIWDFEEEEEEDRGEGPGERGRTTPSCTRKRVLCIANSKGTVQLVDIIRPDQQQLQQPPKSSAVQLGIAETLYVDRAGKSEVDITHCCMFCDVVSRHDILVVVVRESDASDASSGSSSIRFIDLWSRARLREFVMPSVVVSCEVVRGLLAKEDEREYLVAGDAEGHLHAWATDEVLIEREEEEDDDDENVSGSVSEDEPRAEVPSPLSLHEEREEEEEEGEGEGRGGGERALQRQFLSSVELPRSSIPRPSPKEHGGHGSPHHPHDDRIGASSIELPRSSAPVPSPMARMSPEAEAEDVASSAQTRTRTAPKITVRRHLYRKKVALPTRPKLPPPRKANIPSPQRVPEFVKKKKKTGEQAQPQQVDANFGNPAQFNAILHEEALRLQEEEEQEGEVVPHRQGQSRSRFAQRKADPAELARKIEAIERMSFDEESALAQYREAEKGLIDRKHPIGRFHLPGHEFRELESLEVDKSAFLVKSRRAKRATHDQLARELSNKPRLDEFVSPEDFEEEIGYDPFSSRALARRPEARKVLRLTPKRPDPSWEMAFAKHYL